MCWKCGAVRPNDGPQKRKVGDPSAYRYLNDAGRIVEANEAADWEYLPEWPEWEQRDTSGVPYFVESE